MANITNEVLAEKIDSLGTRFSSLEKKVDAMPSAFVSHEVLELKLAPLEAKIIELDRRKTFQTWVVPAMLTIASSVLTFLLIAYIKNGGK